jgi:hypothetical protein
MIAISHNGIPIRLPDDRKEIVGLTILHASQRTEPLTPMALAA